MAEPDTTISFVLKSEVAGEERDSLLAWVKNQHGCRSAQYLSHNPKRAAYRVGHAKAGQDLANQLCEALRRQPQIQAADVEIPRRLNLAQN